MTNEDARYLCVVCGGYIAHERYKLGYIKHACSAERRRQKMKPEGKLVWCKSHTARAHTSSYITQQTYSTPTQRGRHKGDLTMLEHRPRSNPTRKTQDGYKIRRAAYNAAAEHSHKLQCSLFGKTYEPVPEIRKRLDAHVITHTVNKMKHEIDEINEAEKEANNVR